MRRISLSLLLFASSVFVVQVHGACGATTFTPQRTDGYQYFFPTTPGTHQALYITDPANQQYAVFDLEWGGTMASLRYLPAGGVLVGNGPHSSSTELVWGHDTGGMVQPAWFHGGTAPYNPEQAGDLGDWYGNPPLYSRGAPVYGAACKNLMESSALYIYSTAIDFFSDNRGYYARAAGLRHEQVSPNMWFTPYAITTIVTFVPNPNGAGTADRPWYHLKIDQSITNTDSTEGANMQTPFGWMIGMALYMPGTTDLGAFDWGTGTWDVMNLAGSFKYPGYYPTSGCNMPTPPGQFSNCDPALHTKLVVGGYPDPERLNGVAVSTNPYVYFRHSSSMRFGAGAMGPDGFWNNTSLGTRVDGWYFPPRAGKRFVHYVLAGSWDNAITFNPQ